MVGNNQNIDIFQSPLNLSIILFLETKAFIEILIEAKIITKIHTAYTLCLQATTSMTILRPILDHKPSVIVNLMQLLAHWPSWYLLCMSQVL